MTVSEPYTYDWHGRLVKAEFYPGPMDVSAMVPEGPTEIPEGKTAVLVWFAQQSYTDGWWMWEDEFQEHTKPVSIGALRREGVDGDE